MAETEEQITLNFITSYIEDNIELFWKFLKENYGILLIITTFLGGFVQIARLMFISPALISYYATKQSIIDGIFFVVFLLSVAGVLLLTTIFFNYLTQTTGKIYRICLFLTVNSVNITFFVILYKLQLLWLGLFISLMILGITPVLIVEELEKYLNKKHKSILTEQSPSKFLWSFILVTFTLNGLAGYYDLSKELSTKIVSQISNYNIIENNLNEMGYLHYKTVYSNGEYLFLKNDKNKCLIVGISMVTEDIFQAKSVKKVDEIMIN